MRQFLVPLISFYLQGTILGETTNLKAVFKSTDDLLYALVPKELLVHREDGWVIFIDGKVQRKPILFGEEGTVNYSLYL